MIRWPQSICCAGLVFLNGCSALLPEDRAADPGTNNGVAQTVGASLSEDSGDNAASGIATYLSDEFHGQVTASGVPYDKDALVAAHPTLPFETEVRVTNLANEREVIVVIVDRMPERVESLIDVSSAAAAELDMLESGEAEVVIEWFE